MKRNRKTLTVTLIATFILMALLVTYTTRMMYRTSYSYICELGDDKTSAITADLENYLENAKSVLWVAADTVDHMVANGATDAEIKEYITRESANTEAQFDESYTGIYGVIRGNYIDGVGWEPPEGYDPVARDWYKTGVAANGQPVIVSPYVDAQTGNVIISIVKALTDTDSVLGMDLTLSGVQETVEDIQINGNGYGFILNYDGLVIAHPDKGENGKNYSEEPDKEELFNRIMSVGKGNFNMDIDGKECTVFVDEVLEQWHLVIITETSSLFDATRNILVVSVLINLIVFGLISAFFIVGYRYEQRVNRRLEEMKEAERKKDYEAKILLLEKTAADSANKAKSDFLADMSHEIRTPINAVLGMNEMILRESDDEGIIEYASNIRSAGNTLLAIINNILDFSKIEDGKMTLVPVEFDFAELISGLVNTISERAKAKGLAVNVDIDGSVPSKLYGDDVRISQVLMNLLTNGVKYTEKGSVTLRVLMRGEEDGNAKLRFEVADTGIGIREEDIDKLFKSFERIEEKRNRHIEGTGLGISIVTKLLDMMDSKLDVDSEYGEGSTFGFDLRLRIVDREPVGDYAARHRSASREHGEDEHIRAPGARILVTDDNDMNLKVAVNFMKIFGITPVTCTSGMETVELLKRQKFDIIFLDHMMPVMDGIETLKELKEKDLLGGASVIALTANAVVGAEEQYLKEGFDGYLSKPIMLKDIEKVLKNYMPEELIDDGSSIKEDHSCPVSVEKAKAIGLNVTNGIEYSGGEEDFYIEILTEYAKSADDKCASLGSFLKEKDLKDYRVLVHSLKSTSRMVGADDIADKAKALEDASASEDLEFVESHHDEFVEAYKTISGKILGSRSHKIA